MNPSSQAAAPPETAMHILNEWIEKYGKRGVELVSDGWQLAHDPASCGHPRACWLDRNYPESERNYNPDTHTSDPSIDYRCIMCESVAKVERLEQALRKILIEAKSWHTVHDHDGNGCIQCDSICALIPEMTAALGGER